MGVTVESYRDLEVWRKAIAPLTQVYRPPGWFPGRKPQASSRGRAPTTPGLDGMEMWEVELVQKVLRSWSAGTHLPTLEWIASAISVGAHPHAAFPS